MADYSSGQILGNSKVKFSPCILCLIVYDICRVAKGPEQQAYCYITSFQICLLGTWYLFFWVVPHVTSNYGYVIMM